LANWVKVTGFADGDYTTNRRLEDATDSRDLTESVGSASRTDLRFRWARTERLRAIRMRASPPESDLGA
jgi:hypothetical protein